MMMTFNIYTALRSWHKSQLSLPHHAI